MSVATHTQTEQPNTMVAPAPEILAPDEQSLREELKGASQQFFRTLLRVGVHLALAPVYLLPREPRGHFVSAGREFTRGFTSLAHELADNVDKMVEKVESDLTRDV
jgi:hypothetical protein